MAQNLVPFETIHRVFISCRSDVHPRQVINNTICSSGALFRLTLVLSMTSIMYANQPTDASDNELH